MPGTVVSNIKDLYRMAADFIEVHGLAREIAVESDGAVCLTAALNLVAGRQVWAHSYDLCDPLAVYLARTRFDDVADAMGSYRSVAAEARNGRTNTWGMYLVQRWNDASVRDETSGRRVYLRSQEDVVAMLREAADATPAGTPLGFIPPAE